MRKMKILAGVLFLLSFVSWIKPLYILEKNPKQNAKIINKDIIPIFFEGYVPGGYSWTYPKDTAYVMPTDKYVYEGDTSLMIKLDSKTYSGGAVYFSSHDLTAIRNKGALIFYMKAENAGQAFKVELRDGKMDGKDVGTGFVLEEKTSKEWKKVVIPLIKFSDNGVFYNGSANEAAKFDWKDVETLVFSTEPMGSPFILYLDNAYIDPAPKLGDKLKKQIKNLVELKKMSSNPGKYLDRVVISDFDKTISGWELLGGDGYETTTGLRYVPIEDSKIDKEDRKGHGKGVLAVDVAFKPTDFDKSAIKANKSEDWSDVDFIEYEVYMPSDGIDTLTAVPFVQSDNFRRWTQSDSSTVNLKPGKWVKVRFGVHELANLKRDDINAFGTFLWGSVKKPYKGPIYIDNWVKYGKGIKVLLPKVVPMKELKQINQGFMPLNISKVANMGFYDKVAGDGKGGWSDQGKNDLREFKFKGRTMFDGIEFNIIDPAKNNGKSCIVLRGQHKKTFPTKAEIKVNAKGAGIYFLQGASWSWGVVGRYRIVYDDGTEEVVQLRDGREIFNWWSPGDSEVSRVAWVGSNPVKSGIGLSVYAWVNPHPKKTIKKIIAETDGDKSFLHLVAATLTKKGPYLPEIGSEGVDTSKWFTYNGIDIDKLKGSALDVSFILDKPAGKHGFIKSKGDKFFFKDGTEARFNGLDLVASANFPDKKNAKLFADRLATMGVNIVRHHHMDADWTQPNIFGNNKSTTRKLDAKALRKFDYLWKLLSDRGIYHYVDLTVHRVAKQGDGIKYPEDIAAGYKIEGEFVDYLIELEKEYAKQLLLHKNPYTGKRLVDDPSLAMIDIINEDSLFYIQGAGDFAITTPYYKKIWRRLFNEWLLKKFKNKEEIKKRWKPNKKGLIGLKENEDPKDMTVEIPANYKNANYSSQRIKDTYRFIYDTQYKYYTTMYKFLRSIGVKCPITGSNHWVEDIADIHLNAKLDFVDRHQYYANPEGGYGLNVNFNPAPMVKVRPDGPTVDQSTINLFSIKRVFGKPYVMSEWQNSIPNQYVAEGEVFMSVYSCLDNWNPLQFAFSHSAKLEKNLTSNFNVHNFPSMLALWPATALIFQRKDIKEADSGYFVRVSTNQILDKMPMISDFVNPLSLTGKWGLMFTDISDDPTYSDKKFLGGLKKFIKDDVITSTTKQIVWDTKQGLMKFDTPRSVGMVGFSKGKTVSFKSANFKITTEFAAVILNSLTKKPIEDSSHLLLSVAARTRMKGMKYNTRGKLMAIGNLPIIIEPVEGEVTIKSKTPIKNIYRLSLSGERLGKIKVTNGSEGYSFKLTADDKCMHYEIEK